MRQGSRSRLRSTAVAATTAALCAATLANTGCGPSDPRADPVTRDESATVAGRDANSNGVRDDIDQALAALPVTAQMRTYLTDTAKVEQRVMRLDVRGDPATAKASAYDIATDTNKLITCVPAGLDAADARDRAENLRLLISNSDAREAQEAAFSRLIDGQAFPAPTC